MRPTRRAFIAGGAGFLATSCAPARARAPRTSAPRPYRDAAVGAATWLRSQAVRTDAGVAWRTGAAERDTKPIELNLYHGTSGILVFLLIMYEATGEALYLSTARLTANDLLTRLPTEVERDETGLYATLPGAAIGLAAVAAVTSGEESARYRNAARRLAAMVADAARPVGRGVEWNDTYDASYGIASDCLFLLHAAETYAGPELAPRLRDTAVRAGLRLLDVATPSAEGLSWAMGREAKYLMPNFGHGTAGVGYALATLYRATKQEEFRDAAVRAGTYLRSIARTEGGVFLVFHSDPGGRDRYYLSWCHGPPGTGRFLYRLGQITGDSQWGRLVEDGAKGVIESGIPVQPTSGFWNNFGQCCGSAGVADFMLSLHRVTGKATYLDFARRMMDDVLAHAHRSEGGGLSWAHAEHRVRPNELSTQTGYMQGAAGIGAAFARLDAVLSGGHLNYVPIDSPFPA